MVGCYVGKQFEGDIVLVRIYGAATNNFVDTKSELRYIKYLSEQGMCPPLYATFNNGRASTITTLGTPLMFTSTFENALESSEVSRLQSLCTDYIMNSDGQQFYQYQRN